MACAIGIETWRLASLIPVSGHWRWLGFNWYWRYSSGAADAIDIP
jgi:hypothetical protein